MKMKISEVLNKHNNTRAVMLNIETDLSEPYKKYRDVMKDAIDSGFKTRFKNRFKNRFGKLLNEFEEQASKLTDSTSWEYPNDPGLRRIANRARKQLDELNNLRQQIGV